MERPYHHFIFDKNERTFVGKFEEMYQAEETDNFDSWFQEDLRKLDKQISLSLLNQYEFQRILDLGCGKGAFTHLLKKSNNIVVGVDISSTAITRARARYPDIDFRVSRVDEAIRNCGRFDLVLTLELLSYLEDWRAVIEHIAGITTYYYLTLYLPENPMGFVRSFDDLIAAVEKDFSILQEVRCNREEILIMAQSRRAVSGGT